MSEPPDEMPDELQALTRALRTRPPRNPSAEEALARAVEASVRGLVPVLPDATPSDVAPRELRGVTDAAAHGARLGGRAFVVGAFVVGVAVGVGAASWLRPSPRPGPAPVLTTRALPLPLSVAGRPSPSTAASSRDAAPSRVDAQAPVVADASSVGARESDAGDTPIELSSSRVREQLQRAEQLLDDGRAAEALTRIRALDRAAIRSPVLVGLREVLAVRALRDTDHDGEARARAARYLNAHPGSATARELRAVLGE